MANSENKSCGKCTVLACQKQAPEAYPPFCPTGSMDEGLLRASLEIYENNPEIRSLAQCSAKIEADFYCKMPRVGETLEFIKRQKYDFVGVATCVGLINETRIFCSLLEEHGIKHVAVGCKLGGTGKSHIGITQEEQVNTSCGYEAMCNPVLQALYLNKIKTDFNIMIGMCVGHDSIFLKHVEAPTTVLVVKDRVLAHNTVGALYTIKSYYKSLTAKK